MNKKKLLEYDLEILSRYHPIIDDVPAFEASITSPMPRFVWANTLRTTPERLRDVLERDGYVLEPLPWHPGAFRIPGSADGLGRHWSYLAGFFQIQEASAMVPALLLDSRPGERVLDLCAAPGNKTAQVAVALDNTGTVVANDQVGARLRAVRQTINRLGLLNVTVVCHNGMTFPKSGGQFDRVIVDVPCSCEGTSRRRPGKIHPPSPTIHKSAHRQKLLLRQAIQRCRPGGTILYSTCTYAPEENESVIDAILRELSGSVRIVPVQLPGFCMAPGISEWNGAAFHPDIRHTRRIWPHLNDTGGFYVARLEKIDDGPDDTVDVPMLAEAGEDAFVMGTQHPLADTRQFLNLLRQRFGISERSFDGVALLSKHDQEIYGAAADHCPPLIDGRIIGLPLMTLSHRYPKFSTAGATAFGGGAGKNIVDVDRSQLDAYLARETVLLTDVQAGDCEGTGYVLIRYDGVMMGVGLFNASSRTVASMFPKSLAVIRSDAH